MSTVHLPDGTSAELRDPKSLPVWAEELLQEEGAELYALIKQRWPDAKEDDEIPLPELGRVGLRAMNRLNRAGVVALVKSWTRQEPLPTMKSVGNMDSPIYKALSAAVAPLILPAMLGDDFTPAENRADPETPTEPSSD